MAGRQAAVAAAVAAALAGWAVGGTTEAEEASKPKETDWSDVLKGIPLGPFRFDIGGSVRFRYEYQDDFNQQRYAETRPGYPREDGFLLQCTRLELDLHFAEQAHFFVQLQDARVYDSAFGKDDFPIQIHSCPYWDPLDLRQAYLEWLHIGGSPFGVKIGRQAISYGDNHIWGPGEWGNVGRYTWDAVKLIADTPVAEVHGIFANRVLYDPHSFDEHNSDLDAFGAYAMIKKLPFRLDLFWVGKRSRPTVLVDQKGTRVDLDTHTVGFYLDGRLGKGWDYRGTLAHSFGDRDGLDVRAWGANARLGYTFQCPWKPRIGIEYTYASGDHNPKDGKYETFDGVFGAIDAYYGRMNFFSWMNLHDYQLSLSCSPVPRSRVSLDCHCFRLDSARDSWYWCSGRPARTDATGKAGRDLGQEVDLIARYNCTRHLELMAGYARFLPGTFMKRTGPAPDADWFFVQTMYFF